jgi:hypothetical protein
MVSIKVNELKEIRSKQITMEQNFIKYSHNYMFRPITVIIRLTLEQSKKEYTYCLVDVRSRLLVAYAERHDVKRTYTCVQKKTELFK